MTDTYENITLPQTSFSGGKNNKRWGLSIFNIESDNKDDC